MCVRADRDCDAAVTCYTVFEYTSYSILTGVQNSEHNSQITARLSLLAGAWGVGAERCDQASSEVRDAPYLESIVLDSHPPVSLDLLSISLSRAPALTEAYCTSSTASSKRRSSLHLATSRYISLHLPSSPYLEHGLAEAEEQPLGHLAQAGREPAPG